MALPLAPFWLLFAVVNFPLIVPADSDFGLAASRERAAAAGVGMAFMSIVSMLWAAGVFGRSAGNWGCASILLAGLGLAGLLLCPTVRVLVLTSVALPAHAVGIAVVFLGRAGLRPQDAEPPYVHCE